VLAVHRDVHDRSARLRDRRAQFLEVAPVQRAEMLAPRLDLLDVEFRADVRRKLFQLHFPADGFVLPAYNEFPKRVRRHGDSFIRICGELHVRPAASGKRHFPGM